MSRRYADYPEPALVGLARAGDTEAFAALVRRRQSWLRNLQRRMCGDAALADDLAQQTLVVAWQKLRALRQADRFGGWLKKVAVNVYLQHARRAQPEIADLDQIEETGAAARPGLAMDLDQALGTLAYPVRVCVTLAHQEGMTHPEIAAATGLPLGTVKSHVRRGSARVAELLEAYRDEVGSARESLRGVQ